MAREPESASNRVPRGIEGASRLEVEVDGISRRVQDLERASNRWSLARIGAFLLGAGVLFVPIAGGHAPGGLEMLLALQAAAAFAFVVAVQWRTLDLKKSLEARSVLLRESIQRRKSRRFTNRTIQAPADALPLEQGLRIHRDEDPSFDVDPWTGDDVGLVRAGAGSTADGGPRTLLGLLDRTSTIIGFTRLRRCLEHPLRRPEDIRRRQEAVREAAANDGACADALERLHSLRALRLGSIARVLRGPFPFARRLDLLVYANVLGTAPLVCLVGVAVTMTSEWFAAFIASFGACFAAGMRHARRVNEARDRIAAAGGLAGGVLELHASLERAAFTSAEWRDIVAVLSSVRPQAQRLKRLAALIGGRGSADFMNLWDALTLWHLRLVPLAERALERSREVLERAAGALGEAEALICLALPLAEQEGFEMPEVDGGEPPLLRAEEMGHPLIEHESAVRNPMTLGDGDNVILITGSNMSGKSTYLKSAALNLVLACAGGPVCAKGFRFKPMALHADVNVRDSLDDGKSYFQVEVERVHAAVRAAEESPLVVAVFDELFRGTNSEERLAIARAMLRHLRSSGILLLVATHESALTRLVTADHEPGMRCAHFRESVEDGVLRFDYRLREGPATTRNAIRVLETQGFPEEITREARRHAGA